MFFTSCKNRKGKKPVFNNLADNILNEMSENEIFNA